MASRWTYLITVRTGPDSHEPCYSKQAAEVSVHYDAPDARWASELRPPPFHREAQLLSVRGLVDPITHDPLPLVRIYVNHSVYRALAGMSQFGGVAATSWLSFVLENYPSFLEPFDAPEHDHRTALARPLRPTADRMTVGRTCPLLPNYFLQAACGGRPACAAYRRRPVRGTHLAVDLHGYVVTHRPSTSPAALLADRIANLPRARRVLVLSHKRTPSPRDARYSRLEEWTLALVREGATPLLVDSKDAAYKACVRGLHEHRVAVVDIDVLHDLRRESIDVYARARRAGLVDQGSELSMRRRIYHGRREIAEAVDYGLVRFSNASVPWEGFPWDLVVVDGFPCDFALQRSGRLRNYQSVWVVHECLDVDGGLMNLRPTELRDLYTLLTKQPMLFTDPKLLQQLRTHATLELEPAPLGSRHRTVRQLPCVMVEQAVIRGDGRRTHPLASYDTMAGICVSEAAESVRLPPRRVPAACHGVYYDYLRAMLGPEVPVSPEVARALEGLDDPRLRDAARRALDALFHDAAAPAAAPAAAAAAPAAPAAACPVCDDAPAAVLLTCGHGLCPTCVGEVPRCPQCEAAIHRALRVDPAAPLPTVYANRNVAVTAVLDELRILRGSGRFLRVLLITGTSRAAQLLAARCRRRDVPWPRVHWLRAAQDAERWSCFDDQPLLGTWAPSEGSGPIALGATDAVFFLSPLSARGAMLLRESLKLGPRLSADLEVRPYACDAAQRRAITQSLDLVTAAS